MAFGKLKNNFKTKFLNIIKANESLQRAKEGGVILYTQLRMCRTNLYFFVKIFNQNNAFQTINCNGTVKLNYHKNIIRCF